MNQLHKQYGDRVEFYMVYIREAHPTDGWVVGSNTKAGIEIKDPRSADERAKVAATACTKLNIDMPCLVDSMDDKANKAYGAWPDRLFVVGVDGRIAVAGEQGPRGFNPSVDTARRWLAANIK